VVDRVFQNNLERFFDDNFWGDNGFSSRNQVPVNIRETDKTYEMELMAPGLNKQDFKLNIAGDTLTVSFDHKEENKQENDQQGWLRREYRRQSFSRSFNLDDTVDADKIKARYENGTLQLSLPKKENAQKVTRPIAIE
jgi:HSP20 family protein